MSFHVEIIPNRANKPAILLRSRERDLALAAVVARVLAPDSKLATARRLSPETADSSLGALLGLGPVSGNEMLAMLDWLLARQRWIETSLANRHLQDATLLLYDVSSSYLEGRLCPLAAFGYNRDGKKGKQQIVFGLLCSAAGCPLAVEVFPGNTADPTTLGRQVDKIRKRFGIARIALVGDRGRRKCCTARACRWLTRSGTPRDQPSHLLQVAQGAEWEERRSGSPPQVARLRDPVLPADLLLLGTGLLQDSDDLFFSESLPLHGEFSSFVLSGGGLGRRGWRRWPMAH